VNADDYERWIADKAQGEAGDGFTPSSLPSWLFDFQASLVEWALRKGRAAIFADCGMGKTPMQLAWADAVARETGGRVLILTPLAVAGQTVREGEKFGVECSRDGSTPIHVTNYERLHQLASTDYVGGVRRVEHTQELRRRDQDARDRVHAQDALPPAMYRDGAVAAGRRGVGVELKTSYYRQAVRNLEAASERGYEQPVKQPELFEEEPDDGGEVRTRGAAKRVSLQEAKGVKR
jgi:hypothetical protein